MASIFDTAKYILKKLGSLSAMKLQKLCYYSQAWTLAWDEKPLFDEDFQAWANGPVSPALFAFHKGMFIVSYANMPSFSDEENLTPSEKENIDKVISFYGNKAAHWLSELTHQERPWKEARARANASPGDFCNEVITKFSMQDYYSGL